MTRVSRDVAWMLAVLVIMSVGYRLRTAPKAADAPVARVSPTASASAAVELSPEAVVHDVGESDVRRCFLLAYMSEVYSRDLYVEKVLVAVKYLNGTWKLIHAYRHPKEPLNSYWSQVMIFDAPKFKGAQEWPARPTPAQVESFLQATRWNFSPDVGFRLVRGEVYTQAWQAALGFHTAHRFDTSQ